ncbi:hypothetical protein HN014_10740 [Aquimarina sp. TRL1]|uniref:hypothetical protein n=1 Tax=Aquimarina sp. (strain TRL1) TaxID=2736252 RepID=UPI00158D2776|nr:hypothetical protein [Aquimarina sp. TRL1]QKX05371.1 hypothetical protein HN014_10740 [Aquimarina sp. TRL1]
MKTKASHIKQLQWASTLISMLLMVILYRHFTKRKQKRLSVKMQQALLQKFNPEKGFLQEKAFDETYAERVIKIVPERIAILKPGVAQNKAKLLHSGFKPWYVWGGDNEQLIYGVLTSLKDKVQVSQVAKAYLDLYKVPLKEQLQKELDTKEIGKVLSIVTRLNPYTLI